MPYFGKFDKKNGNYILIGGQAPNEARIMNIS